MSEPPKSKWIRVSGCEMPSSTQDIEAFWSPTSMTHANPVKERESRFTFQIPSI